MEEWSRTERLIGEDGVSRLRNASVAVFGIGGVGGYTVEALARAGIGRLLLVDADRVDVSNINRQIIADHTTVGRYKTEVMRERIARINPDADVETKEVFYLPEEHGGIDLADFDFVVDAVDTVSAKLELIVRAEEAGVPVISCMGAGNHLDPTKLTVTDIYKTTMCPLAKVMRRELKKRGIRRCKVVYSTEEAIAVRDEDSAAAETRSNTPRRKVAPGSISYVPAIAGMMAAGEVIRTLLETK